MPTYDYVCPNGHRFEVVHGVHDAGPSECPVCGASPVRKAFAPPTIVFKGSGWAKKDRSSTSTSSTAERKADAGSSESTDAAKPADAASKGSDASSTGGGSGSEGAKGDASASSKKGGSGSTAGNATD
jgi:putative FmdB family regulatory protein